MARETITRLVDDIDGSDADRTVVFAFDGDTYEIDLSERNRERLLEALAPYVEVARRTRRAPGVRVARAARRGGQRAELAAVRTWAAANGHLVAERGRIPAAIIEAYHAAQHAVSASAQVVTAPAARAAAVVAQKAPAGKAPAKRAAAKKTPTKMTTAKKTPAKKTPARKVAAKKAPARTAPAKKAVVQAPRG